MKHISIFFLLTMSVVFSYAQSLDASIKKVTDDLAQKVSLKHRTRIGLLDFINEEGKQDATTSYIQEQVEMDLINAPDLEVMDRKHITNLLSENKLVSSGLIDESTVKKAVSFLKVDGWVIGEITNFGDKFKIKLKVIDVSTSQIFAVSVSEMIDGAELKKIMEPKQCYYCKGTGTIKSYSFCKACDGKGGPVCTSCGGSGANKFARALGNSRALCEMCRGKGRMECQVCHGKGQIVLFNTCTKCNGTGKQI
jgi:hypothetical protein